MSGFRVSFRDAADGGCRVGFSDGVPLQQLAFDARLALPLHKAEFREHKVRII